jgi:hypothetical protein
VTAKPRPSAFWQDIPAILAFPLRGEALAMLVGCALAKIISYALGSSLQVQWLPTLSVQGSSSSVFAVVLGLIIDLIILMLVLKLAVEALVDTAHDRIGPDKAGGMSATDGQAVGQILLLLVFGVPVFLMMLMVGGNLAWLAIGLAVAVLPAAIILQAVDDNLWHSLDPRAWWALLSRLGVSYGVMLAMLACLLVVVSGLQWLLAWSLPGVLAAVLSAFIGFYALLVGYHLMGRVILYKHEALDLDLTPPIVRPTLANAEEDEVMQAAERLLANDEPAAAADQLQSLIARRGSSAPIHERYRQLLLANKDFERLSAHGREYIGVLLALGQTKRAAALLVESRLHDPAFRLDAPEHITALIAHASASGQSQLAVDLADGFNIRFPKDPDIPRNMLTAARLMAERFGRVAEARHLLEGLLEKYPEHPLTPDISVALAEIARMPATD